MILAVLRAIAAAALSFLSISAVCADESNAPVPKPEVHVGDRWTYRQIATNVPNFSYDISVTFVGPDVILATTERKDKPGEVDLSFTSEWNAKVTLDGRIASPYQGLLKFPLITGATYNTAWKVMAQRGTSYGAEVEQSVRAMGWEDVVVPAGKFRALRIESTGPYRRTDAMTEGIVRFTVWYAPEVKRWVKYYLYTRERNEVHELLEFKLK